MAVVRPLGVNKICDIIGYFLIKTQEIRNFVLLAVKTIKAEIRAVDSQFRFDNFVIVMMMIIILIQISLNCF